MGGGLWRWLTVCLYSSSEAASQTFRPQVLFNTTNITTVDISPSGSVSTDADTTVVFSHTVFDHT